MPTANGLAFIAQREIKKGEAITIEEAKRTQDDINEKRRTYTHFVQTFTGTDPNCKHPKLWSVNIGRCYNDNFCDDCKCIFTVDSGD